MKVTQPASRARSQTQTQEILDLAFTILLQCYLVHYDLLNYSLIFGYVSSLWHCWRKFCAISLWKDISSGYIPKVLSIFRPLFRPLWSFPQWFRWFSRPPITCQYNCLSAVLLALRVCFSFKFSREEDMFRKRKGKRRGGRGGEHWMRELPLLCIPTGIQTWNLGMCPDWESTQNLLVYRDNTPSIWATQPRHELLILIYTATNFQKQCIVMPIPPYPCQH